MTRALLLLAYVATVFAANWATSGLGLVPAGFGLTVTAGTYAAGLALGVRDALQDAAGVRWVVAGILGGAALSAVVSPALAVASGAAFLLSESLDLAVYTPLRRRGFRRAVVASNVVGAVVDTLVFLYLAGFPVTAQSVGGQLVVKAVWVTASFLLVAEVIRRAVSRHPVNATGT